MGLVETLLLSLCVNNTCVPNGWNGSDMYVVDFPDKEQVFRQFSDEVKGKTFKIATLQSFPFSYAVKENDTWVGKGVAFDFINILQEKYKFNYVVIPEEEIFGSNYTGVFGLLYNGAVDMAAAFLPVVPTYWEFIRYSTSLDIGEWVVLMKRPKESATGSGLLAPFTWQVWLLVLISVIAVGPIIYFLILLKARLCKDEHNEVYTMPACVWFVYGGLLKQGSTLSPMTDSSRILFATWWIFITILTAFYTANLTAFLTLSQFTLPISKPEDIGEFKYSWIASKGNAIEEASSNTKETLYTQLKGSKGTFIKEDKSEIVEEWIKLRNYMYIGEKSTVERMLYDDYQSKAKTDLVEEERCSLVMTQWPVLIRQRAFAYAKDFKFYPIFDSIMEHIVESGITQYLLRDGLPNTQICPLNLGSKERQLRNSDLILTYKIVGCGFGVSVLIFLVEVIIELMKNLKKKSHSFESKWTPKKTKNNFNKNMFMVQQMDIFGNVIKDSDSTYMKSYYNYEPNGWNTRALKLRKTTGAQFPFTN